MAMFADVACMIRDSIFSILARDHDVLEHVEHHLEPLVVRTGMTLSGQVLQHRLHRINWELAARCMI
jgi:hypothetical protein